MQIVGSLTAERFRKAIALQLKHRFGRLPLKTRKAIERVPDESTEALLIALLDFKQLSDADRWLEQHQEE